MMRELRRFLIAMGYFTRLPVPQWVGWDAGELNRAARYFPWIGLLVALIVALVFWLTALYLPIGVAVLLSMILSLRLTGAFHEDGLADAADGLGGGWLREDVLRIMKDSRIGTYGAAALVTALLLKWGCLSALAPGQVVLALFVAHPLSRLAALLVMLSLPYVREDESSRAKPIAQGLSWPEGLIGALGGLLPLVLAGACGWLSAARIALIIGAVLLVLAFWFRLLQRRLGGYTGDCLGAVQQCSELAIYLVLCAHVAG
jgi:adenosylcobinamide-GDP ribazoletransferase